MGYEIYLVEELEMRMFYNGELCHLIMTGKTVIFVKAKITMSGLRGVKRRYLPKKRFRKTKCSIDLSLIHI